MSYSLNKDGAKQANEKLSGYIDKNGDYILKIELAEWISGQAPSQSRAVRFHLIDANSSKATIDLYFQKKDGTRSDSFANMLDGIMTCLGLQNLTESSVNIAGNNINMCPELENKFIGALIQTEKHAYLKDGEVKEIDKAVFFAVYQHKTNLTPLEILNGNTSPVELPRLKEMLANAKPKFTKDHKKLMSGQGQGNSSYGSYGSPQQQDDLDSDLPF